MYSFTISNFAKLHALSEDQVRRSLEYSILHADSKEDENDLFTEIGVYNYFLNLSLFQLVKSAQENWHLLQNGNMTGTNKMLIAALATRCGWDCKSLI
jgi:hypothetical protein